MASLPYRSSVARLQRKYKEKEREEKIVEDCQRWQATSPYFLFPFFINIIV
jgi:hypothetical protein